MKKITIIGASGHGKVIADIARLNGYDDISFIDDNTELVSCGRYRVVGTTDCINKLDGDFIVGIGNPTVRKMFMEKLGENGKKVVTLIHPQAVIGEDVLIGTGSVIMANAVVNPGTKIGNGVIINTCSSVDHDCEISDYVHIAVGAHICGTVSIGELTWIGAGVTVINNTSVCGNSIVGAGATVIKNISLKGTYVGIPAKRINGGTND